MNEVSKGILMLRNHASKPVTITKNGDSFTFKKLTMDAEDQIKLIIEKHQDPSLKPPKQPEEGCSDEVIDQYVKELDAHTEKTQKLFRRLTCDLMKFMLVDEKGAPLFEESDDLYSVVNNVFAQNFFIAYIEFRGGNSGGVAEAEARFQK